MEDKEGTEEVTLRLQKNVAMVACVQDHLSWWEIWYLWYFVTYFTARAAYQATCRRLLG